MKISVGKHQGKSVEEVVIKHPDYVQWMAVTNVQGALVAAKDEARRLMQVFNNKPFVGVRCAGAGCDCPPTRASLYRDGLVPEWWCEKCDPRQLGAQAWKLQMVKTYIDALSHVERYDDKIKNYASLIKTFAIAKGLPKRVTTQATDGFFAVS